jgi:hypothetical protein
MLLISGLFKKLVEGKNFYNFQIFLRRILVGLRWWSRVRNDGKEEWHYESLEKSKNKLILL